MNIAKIIVIKFRKALDDHIKQCQLEFVIGFAKGAMLAQNYKSKRREKGKQ
jgi:hypothetical protein